MRIALSVETFLPKIDGIVKIACLTLDYLRQYNIEAVIYAPDQGVKNYKDVPVIGLPCFVDPWYPEGKISIPTPNTYLSLRRFKPDLVHLIDPGFVGLAVGLSAKVLGVPTVGSYHLSISQIVKDFGIPLAEKPIRALRVWGFNYVDHALAPSKVARRRMLQHGVHQVGLWRRGVDSQQFHPRFRSQAMRERLSNGKPDSVILLYVGRLSPEKQVHILKKALEETPNVCLALLGGGPKEEELRELFEGLPVNFVGYLQGQELAEAYASADIFTFTSRHEAFGLVLGEAIASGLPVVTTRVGGAEDVVQHGSSGYIVEVDGVDQMADYIRELAADPDRRALMGQRARETAETLQWDDMMRELIYFYEDVVRTSTGRDPRLSPQGRPKSPMFLPKT
ncbi:MAG: glycosyltransferase family 1 protein [Chloroflexi bacterium]|uniref:glycosyltransferase family 4 protein n=1 Tax=Candidatus Flexifilum breve TaxID=3140694 RepID=UPI003135FB81|nr:glycosyltransferase family 1 protein [Chloroflexota bacterium]